LKIKEDDKTNLINLETFILLKKTVSPLVSGFPRCWSIIRAA